jgi:alpha,alpha-trehalase
MQFTVPATGQLARAPLEHDRFVSTPCHCRVVKSLLATCAAALSLAATSLSLGLAGLALITTTALAAPAPPSDLYGALYEAVEMSGVFPDSKTFADAVPRLPPSRIVAEFTAHPPADAAALKRFVLNRFDLPAAPVVQPPPADAGLIGHIKDLWPRLTRTTPQVPFGASALPLPAPYVVPGGRFRELYYWDSYFTLLGLQRSGRNDLVEDMINDFGSLIERYGRVPNGARTYYLSRSQPPVLALMVQLSADRSAATLRRRNGWLIAEHRFWMSGGRVVRLHDGAVLNRYWDDRAAPRDESFREDELLAKANPGRDSAGLWRDVRAAAESGWDFSSRWLADGETLGTIRTTRLAPVDLNSLMYLMEQTIAQNCRQLAERACESSYSRKAAARRRAILSHMWNGRFFADYDLDIGKANDRLTAASAWALFARLAELDQAKTEAAALATLVGPGGISTTPVRSGQQWDAPNGWAPLQWIAFEGLRNYGQTDLAERIRRGWVAAVSREYEASGRLVEKYDVLEQKPGGGGEYPTQDGFGWTNGVTLALVEEP